ncbi:Outer membrane protein beta-barrel domain-containing protein [Catalinimonas alkaloidigena]|uniref:Outer membrane protein beta-barrel domain-containing protein n=1 Tax=Catalinimonas alkaloidigena TaxID=1075417 RepID=A0A1G9ET45_9BACT|nr:porin family protein [Catalinimonas alkaloidigena]SDK79218.1 Outer membrane protein beta-barrel domain-containing protein [Catalinimonas alkaloidigena]
MKKVLFTFLALLLTCSLYAQSNVKVSLRVAPGVSFNRVNASETANSPVENDGSGLRFSAGPVLDFFFADQYAFSTGLWFTPRRVGLSQVPSSGASLQAVYGLQYLQLPAAIKLFTNEIATDTRMYFVIGETTDIKINERRREGDRLGDKVFKPYDIGLLMTIGAELLMGQNTTGFAGLTYNRGLVNALRNAPAFNDVTLKNDFIGIEVGIKF